MNASSWQAVWLLAVEVAAVVGLTWLVAWRLRSVVWQRTLWQAGLIALVGLLVVEFAALFPTPSPKETEAVGPVMEARAEAGEVPPLLTELPVAATELSIAQVPHLELGPVVTEPVREVVEVKAETAEAGASSSIISSVQTNPESGFPLALAIVLGVWVVGSLVLAGRLLVGRFLLLRFCARSQSVYDVRLFDRVQGIAGKLGLKQGVEVLETERIQTPVVFGLVRLTIALPKGFTEKFERRQQEAILAHELAHLAARDPLWYLLADALVSVLWWHPLVWVARARLQVTSELAADEACVLAKHGPETLAECLVSIAQEMHGQGALESIGIEGSGFRSRLGQRVERLLKLSAEAVSRPAVWRTRLVKVGMPVLLLAVLLVGSGWVRRDQSAPWSGLMSGAWNMMAGVLKVEEADIRRDPRPILMAAANANTAVIPDPAPIPVPVLAKLSGKVKVQGQLPREAEVQIPENMKKHLITPITTRFYKVSSDWGLAYSVVYVKHGLEGKTIEAATEPVTIVAKGLQFQPYIAAAQTGQRIRFQMDDPVLHNLSFAPKNPKNKGWNKAMLPNTPVFETSIAHPERMARISSDTMPWAYVYLNVFEHPYFAVTDGEGRFEFAKPLPPGRYTLAVYHRQAGEAEMEVEVKGEGKPVEFMLEVGGAGKQTLKLKAETEKKLDELVLPELFMDGLPLEVALQYLMKESQRLDPEKKGLQMEWRGIVPAQNNGKGGVLRDPLGAPLQPVRGGEPGKVQELKEVTVMVNPVKKGLSFREVLKAVCEGAAVPLQFNIQNGVVVVTAKPNVRGTKRAEGEVQPTNTPGAFHAQVSAPINTSFEYDRNGRLVTNAMQREPGQGEKLSRLDTIKLGKLSLKDVTLGLAVNRLNSNSSLQVNGFTVGLEGKMATTMGNIELGLVICNAEIEEGASLRQALDAVCKGAVYPLQYLENGNKVVFQARTVEKLVETAVAKEQREKAEVSALIQSGKVLYEQQRLAEAEVRLREAIKRDPANTAAFYYLNLIQEARYGDLARTRDAEQRARITQVEKAWEIPTGTNRLAVPNPYGQTNTIRGKMPLRNVILAKLDQMVIKELHFDGVPLTEVVRFLHEESVRQDPEKQGVRFIINSNLDDLPGSEGRTNSAVVDLEKAMITINPPLKNLRMVDAINAITLAAKGAGEHGLGFMVEDYAVVFRQRVAVPPQVFTRIFKVDKDKLIQGLEKQAGVKMMPLATNLTAVGTSNFPPSSAATNQGGQVTGYSVARSREFAHLAQQFFAACGVDMGTNGPGQASTQIFFNDRTGVLMARASLRDLELIAHGLEAIGAVVDNTPIPSGISSAGSTVVRFYKFEVPAYVRGLERVTGKKVEEMSAAPLAAQVNGGRGTTNQHHVQWHQIELLTREFLMAQGADLSAGNFGLAYPQNPEDAQEVRWNFGGSAMDEVFRRSSQRIVEAGKQDGEVVPLGRATNQVAIKPAAESVTRFIKFEIVPYVRGLEKLTGKKVDELAEAELADPVERQNVTNMHHARWKQIFILSKEFLTSQGADVTSGSIMPLYPKEPEALEARWMVKTSAENLEVIQKGIDKILEAGKAEGAEVPLGRASDQVAIKSTQTNKTNGLMATPEEIKRVLSQTDNVSKLVQDAKLLYELRRLEEAEVKLREAMKIDPVNSAAYYYMNLIQEARYSDLARKRDNIVFPGGLPKARAELATPNPYVRTNLARTLTKAQQRIEAKLDQVVIKEVFFDGLPLSEVVRFLREESIKQDPEKVGINFVINSKLDDQPAGDGGKTLRDPLGVPAAPVVSPGPLELNMVLVTINPPLKNLTMREMLSAITNATAQVGKHGLDYRVEDFGVTFRQRVIDPPQLFTRIFKIDPATFNEGLQRVWANSGMPANSSTNLQDLWREFIRHAGVRTDTNSMATNQIFYNDKTGVLMVRASLQDLEVIQTAIEVINVIPPLVQMTGQYVEMSIEAAKALGFNPVDALRTRVTPAWIDETRLVINIPTNKNVLVLGADAPPRMRTISEGQREKLLTDLKAGGYQHASMQAGEQATVDGRQAHVGFATDFETALVADKRNGGRVENWASHMGVIPSFLARPKVYPDGETIRLDWVACLAQVLGHDNSPTSFRNPVMAKDPVPKFRVRYSSSTTILKIGETLLIEGGLVEKNGDTWVTVLMLTPYLIDPAGNRLK